MLHGHRWLLLLALGITLTGCKPSPAAPPAPTGQNGNGQAAVTDPADPAYNPETDPELDPDFDKVDAGDAEPTGDAPATATPDAGEDGLPGTGWTTGSGDEPGTEPVENQEPSTDRDFIDEMVPTLLAGLSVLDHAIANATRPELKELATRLKPDWQARIKTLRSYRQAWFGSPRVPTSEEIDLSYLEPGVDYDWMVADEIVRVMQAGIDVSSIAAQGTPREEIRAFAQEVSSAWPQERTQLDTWIEAWIAEATKADPQAP